ncbi:LptA/OstA family protein [uncultured Devosia sp.]|uniref:LptA/OstA family protein n=1 Tax=uncultured Devosia sp. TaxID=211434 RepID=UPI0035CC7CB6
MKLSSSVLGAGLAIVMSAQALAQQKVEISADTFTVTEANSEAVFSGHVVVNHPTVVVNADRVVATYGSGGTSDIQTFVATGNVKLTTSEQEATGERAVFTPADQLLRLSGNVVVTNAGSTVGSGELVVNLATNVSTFTGGSTGGRVTGVFTSQ